VAFNEPFRRIAAGDAAVPIAGTFTVHVADGDDLHAAIAQEAANVVETLVARADDGDSDPLVGGDGIFAAKGAGGDDGRQCGSGGNCRRPFDEAAASEIASHENPPPG